MLKAKIKLVAEMSALEAVSVWVDAIEGKPSRMMILEIKTGNQKRLLHVFGYGRGPLGSFPAPGEFNFILEVKDPILRQELTQELKKIDVIFMESLVPPN